MRLLNNRFNIIIGVGVIILAVVLIFIKIPYSVSANGRIVPARQWSLTKGNNGELISGLFNHINGSSEGYSVTASTNSGLTSLSLGTYDLTNGHVNAGDTLGEISCTETDEHILELQGDLEIARATLKVISTGDKQAVVEQAKKELTYSDVSIETLRKRVNRLESLFTQKMISPEEYESAADSLRLLEVERAIAQAKLQDVTTGDKDEQIDLLNTQIHWLELQITSLQERRDSYVVTSPISGMIERASSTDTLLKVSDTTLLIVLIPLHQNDCDFVTQANPLYITVENMGTELNAELMFIDRSVSIVNNEQIRVAAARLINKHKGILSGSVVQCNISGPTVTAFEYVKLIISGLKV